MLTQEKIDNNIQHVTKQLTDLARAAKPVLTLPNDIRKRTTIWFDEVLRIEARSYSEHLRALRELRKRHIRKRFQHIDRADDIIRINVYFNYAEGAEDTESTCAVELHTRFPFDDPDVTLSKLTGKPNCTWEKRQPEPTRPTSTHYDLTCPL